MKQWIKTLGYKLISVKVWCIAIASVLLWHMKISDWIYLALIILLIGSKESIEVIGKLLERK